VAAQSEYRRRTLFRFIFLEFAPNSVRRKLPTTVVVWLLIDRSRISIRRTDLYRFEFPKYFRARIRRQSTISSAR